MNKERGCGARGGGSSRYIKKVVWGPPPPQKETTVVQKLKLLKTELSESLGSEGIQQCQEPRQGPGQGWT